MDTEKMYQTYRPLLFSLAYRMLGSVMDAEDIIQEAFLTFNQLPPETNVRNKRAYLCKIVTNRCLNLLQSSAKQREVYVGTWLPEPLVRAENFILNPSEIYQRKETISTAYLLLLQQLSAVERAVFLLKEIFQYPYVEIGEIIGKSTFNCRQIFHRAKKSIHPQSPNHSTKSAADSQVQLFLHSLLEGDMDSLMKLLTIDVVPLYKWRRQSPCCTIPGNRDRECDSVLQRVDGLVQTAGQPFFLFNYRCEWKNRICMNDR
ncbi:sigma-70 family RNA polymerase sigma factor [Paenibacillus chitinolyticus]|uniref:sigma-70 family RNA polymerase sigma factor n=1 Tax=Paenibacillus chitinolyticus TaxID=79263 RepID=UPI00363A8955